MAGACLNSRGRAGEEQVLGPWGMGMGLNGLYRVVNCPQPGSRPLRHCSPPGLRDKFQQVCKLGLRRAF